MNTYTCCVEGKTNGLDFQDIDAATPYGAAEEYLRDQCDFHGADVDEDILVIDEPAARISKFHISAKVEHVYTEAF
jgi:hypothetical protein